jgi:hypothetical protein
MSFPITIDERKRDVKAEDAARFERMGNNALAGCRRNSLPRIGA